MLVGPDDDAGVMAELTFAPLDEGTGCNGGAGLSSNFRLTPPAAPAGMAVGGTLAVVAAGATCVDTGVAEVGVEVAGPPAGTPDIGANGCGDLAGAAPAGLGCAGLLCTPGFFGGKGGTIPVAQIRSAIFKSISTPTIRIYRNKAEACGPTILTSPLALATSAIIEMTFVKVAPGGAGPVIFGLGSPAGLAGVGPVGVADRGGAVDGAREPVDGPAAGAGFVATVAAVDGAVVGVVAAVPPDPAGTAVAGVGPAGLSGCVFGLGDTLGGGGRTC